MCAKLPESQTRDAEVENRATSRVFDAERAKTCRVIPCRCQEGAHIQEKQGPAGINGRRIGRLRTRIAYMSSFVPASQKSP